MGDQIETWGNRIVIRFIGNARFSSPFHHCFIMRFDSLADSRGPQWIHLLSTNSLLISVEFCFKKTDICVSECVVLEYHVRQQSESRRYNHFKQRHTSFWWEKGIISPHYFLMILSDQSTVNSQCSVKSDRCAVLRALPKRLGRYTGRYEAHILCKPKPPIWGNVPIVLTRFGNLRTLWLTCLRTITLWDCSWKFKVPHTNVSFVSYYFMCLLCNFFRER